MTIESLKSKIGNRKSTRPIATFLGGTIDTVVLVSPEKLLIRKKSSFPATRLASSSGRSGCIVAYSLSPLSLLVNIDTIIAPLYLVLFT